MLILIIMETNNCSNLNSDSRENIVCNIICESNIIRFTDLKYKSKLHQEILSRTLKRISEKCNIAKTEHGYYCKK